MYSKGSNHGNHIFKVHSPIAFNIVQFADILKKKKIISNYALQLGRQTKPEDSLFYLPFMERIEGNRSHRSTKTRLKKIAIAIMGTTAAYP